MKKLCCLLMLIPFWCMAQFQNPIIVESGSTSSSTNHITTADFDQDGIKEILVGRGGNVDEVCLYWNNGNDTFTKQIIDGQQNDVFHVASGDLDENGWNDIVAINQSGGNLYWFANSSTGFGNAIAIDTHTTFGKNIQVADFNADTHLDLVVIWQHAFNFYANDGSGNFTKDEILTTQNAPEGLECWVMRKADMDDDGDMDIIVGETRGLVVYENDGQANFTPKKITITAHTTVTALQVLDANNDTKKDLIFHHATGHVSLYLQSVTTSLNFTHHSDLFQVTTTNIELFQAADVDGDSQQDLYTAYDFEPRIRFNQSTNFSNEVSLYEEAGLFINEVHVSDLENDGQQEYIWSAGAGPVAYQRYNNMGIHSVNLSSVELYPNPASGQVRVNAQNYTDLNIQLYDLSGNKVLRTTLLHFNVNALVPGLYLVKLNKGNAQVCRKLIVE